MDIKEKKVTATQWEPVHRREAHLDRSKPVTAAAAALGAILKKIRPNVSILAQGNHHPTYKRMSKKLQEQFTFTVHPNPVYHDDVTPPEVQASNAGHNHRFYGLPELPKYTFVTQDNGRTGNKAIYEIAIDRHKGQKEKIALKSNLRWNTTDESVEKHDVKIVEFDTISDDPVAAIKASINKLIDEGKIEQLCFIELNFPHNPTSKKLTANQYDELYTFFDEVHEEHIDGKGFIIVHDDPYLHACKVLHQKFNLAANDGPYIDTGYSGIFKKQRQVESAFIHSKSKVGEQAGSIGETTITVTNGGLRNRLVQTLDASNGLSWTDERMKKAIETYSPAFDKAWLERHLQTSEQFADATDIVKTKLQDNPNSSIIPGESGILLTTMCSFKQFLGKSIVCPNGDVYTFDNPDTLAKDIVEYIALQKGAVIVPQACNDEKYSDKIFFRFALGGPPEEIEQGIDSFNEGLQDIIDAPSIPAFLNPNPNLQ